MPQFRFPLIYLAAFVFQFCRPKCSYRQFVVNIFFFFSVLHFPLLLDTRALLVRLNKLTLQYFNSPSCTSVFPFVARGSYGKRGKQSRGKKTQGKKSSKEKFSAANGLASQFPWQPNSFTPNNKRFSLILIRKRGIRFSVFCFSTRRFKFFA